MVTLGTGVGGGIILNGKLLSGARGSAGEIGHIHCSDETWMQGTCSCGNRGCLEQMASAGGIVRLAEKLLDEGEEESVLRKILKTQGKLTAKDVAEAGKSGDGLADRAIEQTAMYLGRGIAAICAVIDPEKVLIGGGVSAAGEYLREKIERHFRKQVLKGLRETPVLLAELGNRAGIIGAARLVLTDEI